MKGTKSVLIIVAAAVVVAIGTSVFFFSKYQSAVTGGASNILGKKTPDPKAEAENLVKEIGKLYELPTGETPTVATVSDIKKLAGQPFFANAKNGDKVLIYSAAKKAILYRPDTKKIIEVGPVNLAPSVTPQVMEDTQATKSATATPTAKASVKVALYNGTSKVGLTKSAEQKLKEKDPGIDVVDRSNAKVNTYEKSIIIDLTGDNKSAAEKYATYVGGTVGTLPKEESKPDVDSDILIILGADYE